VEKALAAKHRLQQQQDQQQAKLARLEAERRELYGKVAKQGQPSKTGDMDTETDAAAAAAEAESAAAAAARHEKAAQTAQAAAAAAQQQVAELQKQLEAVKAQLACSGKCPAADEGSQPAKQQK
jgi:hypothetical protein